MPSRLPATTRWRTSSYSTEDGTCFEVADLSDGRIAVRNSTDPDGPTAMFARPEMLAWIKGVKAGEFDDLA